MILFLFIVGLEVDVSVVKRNARAAVTISAAGMILPFGFGAAVSFALSLFFFLPLSRPSLTS